MTEDERVLQLEKQIREFRIVNPDGSVQGGFGPLKSGARSIEERIANIEKSFAKFQLVGGEGVKVAGGIGLGGYIIEAKRQVTDSGSGGTPPPPVTGACCASDGSCSILSSADCASSGGTYQGDNTGCSPNPCCVSQLQLVFSGVSVCNCVGSTQYPSLTIDGTYLVELASNDSFECVWSGTIPNIEADAYGTVDCSDSFTSILIDLQIVVQFIKSSGTWLLNITTAGGGFVFFDSSTIDISMAVANDASCGGSVAGGIGAGTGGTVTITQL